jgi:hypothetical protein
MHASLALLFALASQTAILPPPTPWNGASRALIVPATDPWVTPSEKTNLTTTPRYDETIAYLRRLTAASPQLKMISLAKSPEGRDVWMVIASKEKAFTPQALRATKKPIVFAQAGIHGGEIDGKDAGLMLLRDMTVRGTKRDLLDKANFLFVPIFNVDGHERFTRYGRINQRGPEEMGWRTTARNLNLNRDYMKGDTEEMRGMIRALSEWQPDLYIDLHVTDGADYQYDITYGWNGPVSHSPAISHWLDSALRPAVDAGLRAAGHIPGPLIYLGDPLDGMLLGNGDLRLSHGYGDARHIPSILVENHSLKPYDQRVLGTYVFLESILRRTGTEAASLKAAIDKDRAERPDVVPVSWKVSGETSQIDILGIESKKSLSPISGGVRIDWQGKPKTAKASLAIQDVPDVSVPMPRAYWIPAAWPAVIALLDLHGIPYERIASARDVDVTMYRLSNPVYDARQFEGHVRVKATATEEKHHEHFPAGSVRVSTDQPLGVLAALLLEPSAPDSVFQWGLMDSILDPTEYVEPYIMEPMAEKMLAEDPALAAEFQKKIETDEKFRSSPDDRLQWLYMHTPFYDPRALLYPIGVER